MYLFGIFLHLILVLIKKMPSFIKATTNTAMQKALRDSSHIKFSLKIAPNRITNLINLNF